MLKEADRTNKRGSVTFKGVIKKYGNVTALKKLDLNIEPGQLVTLLGPSGCGKTTTLRLIAGLESASEGTILIGGEDVTHLSATYRKVSMVFQSYALFPHMTVLENVAYGLTVKSVPKKQAHEQAEEALQLVGLAGFGQRLPSELSGGQQQRVAVSRAIVLNPEVLLLDEPLSNLDAKLRRQVREEIRRIQQKLGLTAVYVTHDQEEAMAVSDRIIVMNNAEIAQEGTPQDLYERPHSSFIADFIGNANLVDCELITINDTYTEINIGSQTLCLPTMQGSGFSKGPMKLVLRPNHIKLSNSKNANEEHGFMGKITYSAYLGDQMQYSITSPDLGSLFVISDLTSDPFEVGAHVMITFKSEQVRLVPCS